MPIQPIFFNDKITKKFTESRFCFSRWNNIKVIIDKIFVLYRKFHNDPLKEEYR